MMSSEAVMDLDVALEYYDQDRAFLNNLSRQYWRLWPDTRDKLLSAVRTGDTRTIKSAAHRLKGQAGQLAAFQAQQAADDLENLSLEGSPEELQEAFDKILDAQRALRDFMLENALIDENDLPPL